MRLELNHKEYTYAPICTNRVKCTICAWEALPTHNCVKFCRKGYIFQTVKISPSVFHL